METPATLSDFRPQAAPLRGLAPQEAEGTPTPSAARLSPTDSRALRSAFERTLRCYTWHDQVVREFGTSPLQRIRDVEAIHLDVLTCLATRYGVFLPGAHSQLPVRSFNDLSEACTAAIEGENECVQFYHRLLNAAEASDVKAALRTLQRASRDGHLPALAAWAKQLVHRKPRAHADAREHR